MIAPEPNEEALNNIKPLAVERVLPGERAAIDSMIRVLKDQLERRYVSKRLQVRRDAHPKHHALLSARFEVDDSCPDELRHGIFVAGASYSAVLRFSNGNPEVGHDLVSDIRGLAIKLSGVPKRSFFGTNDHDFLLATGEAFFGTNAIDYKDFPQASETTAGNARFFLKPDRGRLRGLLQLMRGRQLPASPLDPLYFSQTPYRLGPHVVKYQVRLKDVAPRGKLPFYLRGGIRHLRARLIPRSRLRGRDAMRESLVRDLGNGPATLDFLVQRWPDLSTLPEWAVEDATRRWPHPWVRAARIVIPPHSEPEICARDADAEHFSFQPWRVSPEHQPLGGISRTRLAVYKEMSKFRNELNGIRQTPNGH